MTHPASIASPLVPFLRTGLKVLLVALAGVLAAPGAAHADETAEQKAAAKELIAQFKAEGAADRQAAAEAAVDNPHSSLYTPLTKLLSDKDAQVRMAALDALETRAGGDKKKASKFLVARLGKLEKSAKDEFLRALEVIGTLGDASAAKPLLADVKIDSLQESVEARFAAVARIPHADAFDSLLQFLARGRRGGIRWQRNLCVAALKKLTGQKYGHDPDSWRRWWKAEGKDVDLLSIKIQAEEAEAQRDEQQERRRNRRRERDQSGDGS